MNTVEAAETALKQGDLPLALQYLQDGVRAQPANAKLRIFLFQLLAVDGQWTRAMNQLSVCGEMDAGTLAMVNTYREAIKCEALRDAVFKGQTTPMVFGKPQTWVAHLVEALQADVRGDHALAAHLREQALEAAPAVGGTLNDQPFEWVADADSRLGPVLEVIINGRYGWLPFSSVESITLEPPSDLRDMVWLPASLGFPNGGGTVALVPTRYAPMPEGAQALVKLSRRTDWIEVSPGQYRGVGQRLLTTDQAELGLLDVRKLTLNVVPDEASASDGASGEGSGQAAA
ncbi:MAG: virulence protein SciE type [Burkholderiales bacterium]|jgi:type VI secretion system protein ImpE|nr:MAG: virulence protein SciE type [Burkholderiales bacterium]